MIQLAFSIMAIIWPRPKRQELYDLIIDRAFSDSNRQWPCADLSSRTKGKQPCHILQVQTQDAPAPWFRNLKALQLRHALGLDCILEHRSLDGYMVMGELYAKMNALTSVVGETAMKRHKIPLLKRKVAIRTFPDFPKRRLFVLHRSGLRRPEAIRR